MNKNPPKIPQFFFNRKALIGTLAILSWQTCSIALAQIIPDSSLPTNSHVMINGNIIRIEGGSKVGGNLFHSFSDFSNSDGTTVFFNNPLDVQNIFTRITGNTSSNINGVIQSNGTANLFLINPNGITFGPNAALNIGGSFIGSSANNIQFTDGTQFSVKSNNLVTHLLTITAPIGLQFNANAGNIINQSTVSIPNITHPIGLAVQPGKTLALIGGNILLSGGVLTASGGRIELSAVGDNNRVSLTPIATGFMLGIQDLQNLRDIQLSQGGLVNTSGIGGGDIQLQGRQISLQDGASLLGLTLGNLPGGKITVNAAQSLTITGIGDYENVARKLTTGNVGLNELHSGIFAITLNTGKAGNIMINTPQLIANNGAYIATSTLAPGQGGNILLNTSLLQLNSSFIATGTAGINSGDAGDLTINTNQFIANNNAILATSSFGNGKGGNLTVNATDLIKLIGIDPFQVTPNTNVIAFTGFSSGAVGTGKAGNILVNTKKLIMLSGAELSASVYNTGDGGNITINATKSLEVVGISPNGKNLTSINALTNPGSTGQGGSLLIQTPNLTLQDGGRLGVRSQGTGKTGNLQIIADQVKFINQAGIEGTSSAGAGANLSLSANTIQLSKNSFISATAGTAGGVGDGGNINIHTHTLGLLENSSIVANTFLGTGGNITINTQGNFISTDSSITASSKFGIDGTVTINNPNLNSNSGVILLSQKEIDALGLIARDPCKKIHNNSFIITGKGGLPHTPFDLFTTNEILADLGTELPQTPLLPHQIISTSTKNLSPSSSEPMMEATGWIIDQQGKVKLVTDVPQVNNIWYHQVHCRDS